MAKCGGKKCQIETVKLDYMSPPVRYCVTHGRVI